ncbi:PilN domain-containing protein [Eleftheria terrae]|uniref:PilN domain-containing protein n=1 Tax=Eleftheria terrae TaxID=1597781 RepID=UPI00263BAAD4|nr:PilN domain-containing protein [Eleftheria terrae]WKB51926.1 PilN domain-containing protein [Eleftheria terrae]
MILINLLPHREEKRRRRKQAFFAALGFFAGVGALVVGGWYTLLQLQISEQEDRNQTLKQAIAQLDEQIKDIATLRAEIDALKARQKAVEDLQTDRNMPVHLLNELVKQTPEGVYLAKIRQDGQAVTVSGIAQTNERVSELLRNTAYNSEWLERPELVEIRATNVMGADREQKRLFEFSMRVALKRPQGSEEDPAAAGGAAGKKAPKRS